MTASIAIPKKSQWETVMTTWGAYLSSSLVSGSLTTQQKLDNTYFDAQKVFYNIANYTGDTTTWETAAERAETVYRDGYVIPIFTGGSFVPSDWQFPHGLAQDFIDDADTTSKTFVETMSTSGETTRDSAPVEASSSTAFSRDVAYAIMTYLQAERVGQARRSKLVPYVNQALGFLSSWFVKQDAPFVRPFEVALVAKALIEYADVTPSFVSTLVVELKIALDWLWANTWVETALAFQFTDRTAPDGSGGQETTQDYNLLIAPVFAWVYHQTGIQRFLTRGDKVFSSGVPDYNLSTGAHLGGAYLGTASATGIIGEIFNLCYIWSDRYITLREQEPVEDDDNVNIDLVTQSRPMYVPVAPVPYDELFASRGWATWQDKIDEGYPLWCQPGALLGSWSEVVDLEAVISSGTLVDVILNSETLAGTVNIQVDLGFSLDATTITWFTNQESVFTSNFRYVHIKLTFAGVDDKSIEQVRQLRLKLSLKKKRDEGSWEITNASTGVVVEFNESFADIIKIGVSPLRQSNAYTVITEIDFDDSPNPTSFTVYARRSDTGALITAEGFWDATGS